MDSPQDKSSPWAPRATIPLRWARQAGPTRRVSSACGGDKIASALSVPLVPTVCASSACVGIYLGAQNISVCGGFYVHSFPYAPATHPPYGWRVLEVIPRRCCPKISSQLCFTYRTFFFPLIEYTICKQKIRVNRKIFMYKIFKEIIIFEKYKKQI